MNRNLTTDELIIYFTGYAYGYQKPAFWPGLAAECRRIWTRETRPIYLARCRFRLRLLLFGTFLYTAIAPFVHGPHER